MPFLKGLPECLRVGGGRDPDGTLVRAVASGRSKVFLPLFASSTASASVDPEEGRDEGRVSPPFLHYESMTNLTGVSEGQKP